MPRKKFEPTDSERSSVEAMAGYGLPHAAIAALIRDGIDDKTLRKYFRRELDTGKAKANVKVAQTLFQQATSGGSIAAAIFWMKSQAGWREVQRQEITGADGGPVQTQNRELPASVDDFV